MVMAESFGSRAASNWCWQGKARLVGRRVPLSFFHASPAPFLRGAAKEHRWDYSVTKTP